MAPVNILLATCNGERFLQAQLESLLAQNFSDWRCLIRDDGSADGTMSIIESYANKYPDKFFVVRDNLGNLGPSGNFSELMKMSDSPYVMFCDQDDVWFPEKIEQSMRAIKELETQYGENTPLLVHTDMEVVTETLSRAHHSFMKWQRIDPGRNGIKDLLLTNIAVGATVLINRALLKKSSPVPQGAIMHDYWLAWVASVCGRIFFLDKATAHYRVHDRNVSARDPLDVIDSIRNLSETKERIRGHFAKATALAEILLKRYGEEIGDKDRAVLNTFISLQERSGWEKRWILFTNRFSKHRIAASIAMFILC